LTGREKNVNTFVVFTENELQSVKFDIALLH